MSSSPGSSGLTAKQKKVIVPRVWKRPHSTIYGKNVEYGSSLYSDKIGEINGRKFNSELPWQVRNSGSISSASTSGNTSQGYLSKCLLNDPESTLIGSVLSTTTRYYPRYSSSPLRKYSDDTDDDYATTRYDNWQQHSPQYPISGSRIGERCQSYAQVLEATNPNRYSRRMNRSNNNSTSRFSGLNPISNSVYPMPRQSANRRIDFFDNYLNFSKEISQMNEKSLLANEPLLRQNQFNKYLDFDNELGLFVPNYNKQQANNNYTTSGGVGGGGIGCNDGRCLIGKRTIKFNQSDNNNYNNNTAAALFSHEDEDHGANINSSSLFVPIITTTTKHGRSELLPKHECQLACSPYGQSADGRKLSLGSINPHSYRPSLPHKTTTVQSSDGEEFEFHDRSSPFYTDRWAGKTIRHFDSDLYSNANLFKSMIL